KNILIFQFTLSIMEMLEVETPVRPHATRTGRGGERLASSSAQSARGRSRPQEAAAISTALPNPAQIDRGEPIPEQVYALLRQSIITMRLPPGAVIIEKQITAQLAISRTPVRDALRQLADEGLINVKPQSGTFVALIDRQQLVEGRLIRRALEIEG